MKTRMYFGWLKTTLIGIVIAGALALIALDIVMLVGTSLKTASPTVAWVSLAAAVIVLIAAILILFNSFYCMKDDSLQIVFGFFTDKLAYTDIITIKQNSTTSELFIVYKSDKDGEQTIRLNLIPRSCDKFLEELRNHCSDVIIEPFTPPEKKKKS